MMHFHEDHEEFQGKTPKQKADSQRMMIYCAIAFLICLLGMLVTEILQNLKQ